MTPFQTTGTREPTLPACSLAPDLLTPLLTRNRARSHSTEVDVAPASVLVVDDDINICELLREGLALHSFDVTTRMNAADALEQVSTSQFDAIVADVRLPGPSGLALCERLATSRPDIPVVLMTAHGDMDTAIQAIRAGAYDFVVKPFKLDLLALSLRRAVQHRVLKQEVVRLRKTDKRAPVGRGLLGESRAMREVFDLIERLAEGDATVLITGESGTGKELVARAIHDQSKRGTGPFVAINCAAMPPTLLESELFGHAKGAFTDAKSARAGLFVQATGGTLFLDEIGEMPWEMQAKVLRVLQEHRVRPVGSDLEVPFDTRIVAATNRNLEADVEEGGFRQDLYYRINVVWMPLPSLRARGGDVLVLAQQFIRRFAERNGKQVVGLTSVAARKLIAYDWPGNVRELENCMERAVTLTRSQELGSEDLPDKIRDHKSSRLAIDNNTPDEMPTLSEMERRYIRLVIETVDGNKAHAARILGINRRTLYRKINQEDHDGPGE